MGIKSYIFFSCETCLDLKHGYTQVLTVKTLPQLLQFLCLTRNKMGNFNSRGKCTETASKEMMQLWKSTAFWVINSHNELVSTPIIILFYYNPFD